MKRFHDEFVVEDNYKFLVKLIEEKCNDKVRMLHFAKENVEFILDNSKFVSNISDLAKKVESIIDLTSSLYNEKITRLDVEGDRVILDRFTQKSTDLNSFLKNLRNYAAILMEQSLLRNGIPYSGIENISKVPLYDTIEAFQSCKRCVHEYLSARREKIEFPVMFSLNLKDGNLNATTYRLDIEDKKISFVL